jgi:hypothetical protein
MRLAQCASGRIEIRENTEDLAATPPHLRGTDSALAGTMASQHWGLVTGMVCVVAACGGRAASGDRIAGNAGAAPSVAAAAGGETAGTGAGAEAGRAAEAGADPGCRGKLADLEALDVACPAELCAGTVSASACETLPAGVIRTSEASCDGDPQVWTLTFELSATHRKACYYARADDFEAPALLVGARVWADTNGFCDGAASQISAGVVPPTDCLYASSATLCDLVDPTQSPPVDPNIPPRACFNAFGGSCEPCCDTKPPDCTGKPQGYPGYDCTPPAEDGKVSYCSCACDQEQWTCPC